MSSLRRPFLALTLFSVLYVLLALMGVGPGSSGLRSALLGIREDPLWGTEEPPTELKMKLRVQDIRLQYFNLTVRKHPVNCLESPWVLRSSISQGILILHGSSQSLSVWEETLRLLSTWGHRAVAVQLPDWTTPDLSHPVPPELRATIVSDLISALQFSVPPVLVASSRGGLFAIPYLERKDSAVGAFIAIGITVPSKCRPQDLQEIKVPGLAIYIEGDTFAARVARLLTSAPQLTVRTVPPAKTQPISDILLNPPAVHRLIYHFLISLGQKPKES